MCARSSRVTVGSSGSSLSSPRSFLSDESLSWTGAAGAGAGSLSGLADPRDAGDPTLFVHSSPYSREAVTLTPSIAEGRQRVASLRSELQQLEHLQRELDLN